MEAINKQEKQLKKIKTQKNELIKKIEKKEKLGRIVLLKSRLNDILTNFDMNFNNEGENILQKLAKDKRMINYNNLFFKTGYSILKKIWYIV